MASCADLIADSERTGGAKGDALSKVAKSEIAQGQKAPWADAPATRTYAPPTAAEETRPSRWGRAPPGAAEPPAPPRRRGRRAPAPEPARRGGAPPERPWRRGAG